MGFLPIILGAPVPPANVQFEVNHTSSELRVSWDPVLVTGCIIINYVIDATEGCGECPGSVTTYTTVKCQNISEEITCTFSVSAEVCGVQSTSEILNVNFQTSTAMSTATSEAQLKIASSFGNVLNIYNIM